ncbi:MAG: CRISPR-associated protein Cas4 [Nitrososphaerota archaeon]
MIQNLTDIEGIKGEYFYHFYSCHTRLWLYHRNVSGSISNEHVMIGKYVDEESFEREGGKLVIDGVCSVDFIKEKNRIEVHEIKKGNGNDVAQEMQVEYYMYVLKRLFRKDVAGFLHYPLKKKVKEVILDDKKVIDSISEIKLIISSTCPPPVRKPICRGCSYAEVCWS